MSLTEKSAHAAASISTADIRSTTATASGGDPFPGRNRRAATNNSKPVSENCARRSRNDFISDKTEPVEGVLLEICGRGLRFRQKSRNRKFVNVLHCFSIHSCCLSQNGRQPRYHFSFPSLNFLIGTWEVFFHFGILPTTFRKGMPSTFPLSFERSPVKQGCTRAERHRSFWVGPLTR